MGKFGIAKAAVRRAQSRSKTSDIMPRENKRILVLNGPNLNMLGSRDPDVYGRETLSEIMADLIVAGSDLGAELTCKQSNLEGDLVTWLQEARDSFDAVLLNAGGYTHTSVAIRDAIETSQTPTVEVHVSNVHAREDFRHISLIAANCIGSIAGFGSNSYHLALKAALDHLSKTGSDQRS